MDKELASVVFFLIEQASKAGKRYAQREFDLKGLDITIDQWVLLKIIEENKGISQNELATISFRDTASITRTLNILERKELVKRLAIEGNKRQYQLTLTDHGKNFIEKNMEMVKAMRSRSLNGLKESEVVELKRMLKVIRENLE